MAKKTTVEKFMAEDTHRVIFQGLSGRRYDDMRAMIESGVDPVEVAAHFEVPTAYVLAETKRG
jgi:hypothetical protein